MSVNTTTFSAELLGLLPSTSYNCCVSAVYGSHPARAVCTEIATIQPPPSDSEIQTTTLRDNSTRASSSAEADTIVGASSTIGGVLGFIIAVLLILLAVLGAALVYLLRPKFLRNSVPKQ
jgi:hypothetical protein